MGREGYRERGREDKREETILEKKSRIEEEVVDLLIFVFTGNLSLFKSH